MACSAKAWPNRSAVVVAGEPVELAVVAAREGEDLCHVYPGDAVAVQFAQDRGDDRSAVVAVRAIAVVTQPAHQLRPGRGDAPRVPAMLVRLSGEREARQRRDDHVEGRGVGAAVRARVGEWTHQPEVLDEAVGPPVRQDERDGVRPGGADVHEVDTLRIDLGGELRKLVQLRLPRPPVEGCAPAVDQVADIGDRDAVLPPGRGGRAGTAGDDLLLGQLLGPPGTGQPVGQVVEVRLRYLDAKRGDAGIMHGGRLSVNVLDLHKRSQSGVAAGSACRTISAVLRTGHTEYAALPRMQIAHRSRRDCARVSDR